MTEGNDKEIAIERVINAPRDKVWAAWTTPAEIEKWWGPRGMTTRVDEMDFREGGVWQFTMIDGDGNEYPSKGVYKEIVEEEKVAVTDEFGDSENNERVAPEGLPVGIVNTVTFEEAGDQTKVTVSIVHRTLEDKEKHEKMGVVEGFGSMLDKFDEYLQN